MMEEQDVKRLYEFIDGFIDENKKKIIDSKYALLQKDDVWTLASMTFRAGEYSMTFWTDIRRFETKFFHDLKNEYSMSISLDGYKEACHSSTLQYVDCGKDASNFCYQCLDDRLLNHPRLSLFRDMKKCVHEFATHVENYNYEIQKENSLSKEELNNLIIFVSEIKNEFDSIKETRFIISQGDNLQEQEIARLESGYQSLSKDMPTMGKHLQSKDKRTKKMRDKAREKAHQKYKAEKEPDDDLLTDSALRKLDRMKLKDFVDENTIDNELSDLKYEIIKKEKK